MDKLNSISRDVNRVYLCLVNLLGLIGVYSLILLVGKEPAVLPEPREFKFCMNPHATVLMKFDQRYFSSPAAFHNLASPNSDVHSFE